MKTVVFVCILSLSMCFGAAPIPDESTPKGTGAPAGGLKTEPTLNKDEKLNQNTTVHEPVNSTAKQNDTKGPVIPPKEDKSNVTDKGTGNGSQETGTTENQQPNKTASSASPETQTTKTVTQAANVTNSTTAKANTTAINDKKTGVNATTIPPAVVTSTVAPAVTEKPAALTRGFDGASFVGGIILTLGLLAIGFMGFKYYKNQTERNYHTL